MSQTSSDLGAVLIVARDRHDRRVLFDCLDGAEFEAIYSARDAAQAGVLIDQNPNLALIFVEFLDAEEDSLRLCEALHGDARWRAVPIVAVVNAAQTSRLQPKWEGAGVKATLQTPVQVAEVKRIARELTRPAGHAAEAPAGHWLEQLAAPALLVELASRTVRSSNSAARALLRRSPDNEVLPADFGARLWPAAGSGLRVSAREPVQWPGQAPLVLSCAALPVDEDGQQRSLLVLGDPAPDSSAHWSVLDEFARSAYDPAAMQAALKRLIANLNLDLFYVALERGGTEAEPQALAAFARTGTGTSNLWQSELYRGVLAGKEWMVDKGASGTVLDAILKPHRLESLIALAITGDSHRPHGALIAGSRQGFPLLQEAVALLRAVGGLLGLQALASRYRSDSRYQGLHDSLTRLPNRLLLSDRLQSAIAEATRTGESFAVLFVDLDRFKVINDSLGHAVGDQVLVGASRRLRASVRASDTVARYAGDEFIIILRHIVAKDDVLRVADKIVRVLETPLTLTDGRELQITASIGIAYYPDDGKDAEILVKRADVAMYNAKGLGRNTFQTYVAVPEESHQQRIDLESKLRVAERNQELRAYYQPQMDAQTEDIVGMEALIRWEHPELGLISPGFFIPIAEESGLIVPIGEWILRTACRDAKQWNDRHGLSLRVSVNLSALQLKQANLVDAVRSALEESGLPPDQLDLEVTESLSIKEIPNLLDVLSQLKGLGCHIAIDDFGTGQSSLDYIKRFPADRIKIDQTFVRNIGVDPADEAIVRATINMARNTQRVVVAEGVETEDHLRFLREFGCQELQGFLFCRPLPAKAFDNLLVERARMLDEIAAAAMPDLAPAEW